MYHNVHQALKKETLRDLDSQQFIYCVRGTQMRVWGKIKLNEPGRRKKKIYIYIKVESLAVDET